LATGVPSVGFRCFWLLPPTAETPGRQGFQPQSTPVGAHLFPLSHTLSDPDFSVNTLEKNCQNWEFENQFIRVKVSGKTGDVIAIFDKINYRDILKNPGHQLRVFRDEGQYWDAWNIDPNYLQYPLEPPRLESIALVEEGSLRLRLRVIKKINNSEFCQDYVLSADSPILRIENRVDWRERHVLVKAYFPLTIRAELSAHEIPAGTIERETDKKCDRAKAKWEIPVLNWGDLSDRNYGISVLNNCKYGYNFQADKIGLTLLRGSTWPDPDSDIGIHEFAYGIYPHRGNWREGETVRRGYEFNQPLQVQVLSLSNFSTTGGNQSASFLKWDAENVILMALKRSHTDPKTWILRSYECHGREAVWQLQNSLGVEVKSAVNLLEEEIEDSEAIIHPWEVASVAIAINP
jgi:alpha-mannosidase